MISTIISIILIAARGIALEEILAPLHRNIARTIYSIGCPNKGAITGITYQSIPDNKEIWAPQRGTSYGVSYEVQCPNNGIITGIRYRVNWVIQALGFYCTSSQGEILIGPYGGGKDGSSNLDAKCPAGTYIKSINGRSAQLLDSIGLNCQKFGETGEKVQVKQVGGAGGTQFDDESFATNGKRPVLVKIWASDSVASIQIKYANDPLPSIQSITTSTCVCTNAVQSTDPNNKEIWAPQRGTSYGVSYEVQCPNNGIITGIRYRVDWVIQALGFYCTSSLGEILIGPYGGGKDGSSTLDTKCPSGTYIKSINGRSAQLLDSIGLNCQKFGETGEKVQVKQVGGAGGTQFDDESFATNGKRPVIVKIWASDTVASIQIKYANDPLPSIQSITTTTSVSTNAVQSTDYNNKEIWAPQRGTSYGVSYEVQCPNNGIITGIRYRVDWVIQALGFYCTSSLGEILIDPYGGGKDDSSTLDAKCPSGTYIKSINGRSAQLLDSIGLNCQKFRETGEKVQVKQVGGAGGTQFDDESFATNGKRPVIVKIWASDTVASIQIKYANDPLPSIQSITTTTSVSTNAVQSTDYNNKEIWAPQRGTSYGVSYEVQCPNNGIITGIRYRVDSVIQALGFYCTSIQGEILIGPYGGGKDGSSTLDAKCPSGTYIKSINGRSAQLLDSIGLNCQKFGETGEKVQVKQVGGAGGTQFDDESFATNGKRPVIVKIWASDTVASIQIKYANDPLPSIQSITTTTSVSTNAVQSTDYNNKEIWAPQRGTSYGVSYEVQCPNNGIITGIRYRVDSVIQALGFYCTSIQGEILIGPYGGGKDGSSTLDTKCPSGTYIKSINGRSAQLLDSIGLNCQKFGKTGEKVQVKQVGGAGGTQFDDESFATNGKRPVIVKIWASDTVASIQIKYANDTLPSIQSITTTTSVSTNAVQSTDYNNKEIWAPQRGTSYGVSYEVQCPNNGIITGIRYRVDSVIQALGFYCTSSQGEILIGPYGGGKDGSSTLDAKCPAGSYIKSINGRCTQLLDSIGLNCQKFGETGEKVQVKQVGGTGGTQFDDESFATNGKRPVLVKIWASDSVAAIQIKYANDPLPSIQSITTSTCVTTIAVHSTDPNNNEIWAPRHGMN